MPGLPLFGADQRDGEERRARSGKTRVEAAVLPKFVLHEAVFPDQLLEFLVFARINIEGLPGFLGEVASVFAISDYFKEAWYHTR